MPRLFIQFVSIVLSMSAFSTAYAQSVEDFATRARTAFQDGDYQLAIDLWESAYDLQPDALLKYNISIAYGKQGDLTNAIRNAELADAQRLTGPTHAKNKARLNAFRIVKNGLRQSPNPNTTRPAAPIVQKDKTWLYVGGVSSGVSLLSIVATIAIDQSLGSLVDDYDRAKNQGDVAAQDRALDAIEPRQTAGKALTVTAIVTGIVGISALIYYLIQDDSPAPAANDDETVQRSKTDRWEVSGSGIRIRF